MWLFKSANAQASLDIPPEVMNWKLYWGAFVFGILGTSRGLDEGLVGGMVTLPSFRHEFDIEMGSKRHRANVVSNITSMLQLGCIAGSLLAFKLCDKLGRVRTLRLLCILWLLGFIIVIVSPGNVGQVLAGRFIAGLGVGMTVIVGPTYLAEVAPKTVRGMLVNLFAGSVYLGSTIAYFSNWRASVNLSSESKYQWIAPETAHIAFASLLLILSFTVPETPRFYVMKGNHDRALRTLCLLRNLPESHPYIQAEMYGIREEYEHEQEASHGVSAFGRLRELFLVPANRYRLMLSLMPQILGQWSGANAVTIYAPQFFSALGTRGQSQKLFATCIIGVVKLTSAYLCALFLIDVIGRRRSLYYGIALQTIALAYIAIFLGVIGRVRLESGDMSVPQKHAAVGAVAMLYLSGVGWTMGWNSFQYLVNADIWPLRLRALGSSITMSLHFLNQFGNTKAVPQMLLAMQNVGFFTFCAAVGLISIAWVWLFVPELTARSIESTDELFSVPWYQVGRYGSKLAPDTEMDLVRDLANDKADIAGVEQVEHSSPNINH